MLPLFSRPFSRRSKECSISFKVEGLEKAGSFGCEGDLAEIYSVIAATEGPGRARRWCWWQVLRLIPAFLLDGFAERIGQSVGLFLIPGLAVLVVSLLTVSYHTLRSALTDPVKSLRYE